MTTAHEYSDVPQIFLTACKLPTTERSAYLDTACASHSVRTRVEAMLEADASTHTVLDGSALDILPALADDTTTLEEPAVPDSIGPYRIVDKIAQGGMGTVYLGLHPKTDRIVAIKVIRAGFTTEKMLHRFAYEARLLARLHHPGIAQIFEASTHDAGDGPQPYLAIEFVEGPSLLDFTRDHKLKTKARLALMLKLCDAVQHAHQQGVIHRDLKPNNIVVGQNAQPKILDFGVARDIDAGDVGAQTLVDVQQVAGTLPFMAPEQIAGGGDDVDTRCDVYALGVIGYQLLSGRLPYAVNDVSMAEAARIIHDEEPVKLGKLRLRFVGDIENIFEKALSKAKEDRYPTAQSLGNDIRRYLADEPIAARRLPPLTRARKFVRRNKALMSAAAAFVVTLALGAGATAFMWHRAEQRGQETLDRSYEAVFALARADALAKKANERLAELDSSIRELNDERENVKREEAENLILKEVADNAHQAALRVQAGAEATLAFFIDATELEPEGISALEKLVHEKDELGPSARARTLHAVGRAYANVDNDLGADRTFADAMKVLDNAYIDYLLRTSEIAALMGHEAIDDEPVEVELGLHASVQLSQAEHFLLTDRPRDALEAAEGTLDKLQLAYGSREDAPVIPAVLTQLLALVDLGEIDQARELRVREFGPVAALADQGDVAEGANGVGAAAELASNSITVESDELPPSDELEGARPVLTTVDRAKLLLVDAGIARVDAETALAVNKDIPPEESPEVAELKRFYDEFAALRPELSEHRSLLWRHDVVHTQLTKLNGDNFSYASAVRVLHETIVEQSGPTSFESIKHGLELVDALRVAGRIDDARAVLDTMTNDVRIAQRDGPLKYIDGAWIAERHVESAELLLQRATPQDITEASMVTGLALAELTAFPEPRPLIEARTNMLRGLALAAEGYAAEAPPHLEAALDNALTQPRDLERRRLALESLYDIHRANGNWDDARSVAVVLYDVVTLQNEELRRASAKIRIADALRELQRFDEERAALVEAEQLRLDAYGSPEHPEVFEITQRLSEPDGEAVSQGSG